MKSLYSFCTFVRFWVAFVAPETLSSDLRWLAVVPMIFFRSSVLTTFYCWGPCSWNKATEAGGREAPFFENKLLIFGLGRSTRYASTPIEYKNVDLRSHAEQVTWTDRNKSLHWMISSRSRDTISLRLSLLGRWAKLGLQCRCFPSIWVSRARVQPTPRNRNVPTE